MIYCRKELMKDTTYDGDYGRGRDFSNEVIFVDGNTRQFIERTLMCDFVDF